ncbi:glycosyltransferase family 2 protein [Zymomonas mobilis]|uniref:Dolichyl-phosphate beta-D-mannosyltransferase n=1 Tax=Zymomonas mobilis subsp. pomaceae (strain ATCC 29192 / DSM 22645 / JCM 10191 / CCUG 17912 / NBRC 13757 / NCIMB 11200 / NRRL B-4491 / Barker I) TaxID=579138 RepID=F8ES41_ZYMMT|nr:glycosyltransferase family 2 protein [Zymomonas mobilis]AEI37616.1 Dolichyl-phosphate beta-D-mannosyltransferase [Zymomonas mobilis subsp. pomaceae ATCC 29192]MDX5948984.1 glycosyltransferase family 2 protein [Zymomonas mobilis subsp. pomaceae]GEB88789.1 dolichol monophosphate mannose synthase [Zymomonas mobilis subsp. pomaceae]
MHDDTVNRPIAVQTSSEISESKSDITIMSPRLSVVIPTYNEKGNIEALVSAVRQALIGIEWEMIVVDDDSPDETYELAFQLSHQEPRLHCIRRVGRRGLSSAVVEGALAANGDFIAVMDADFQHDEKILKTMYKKMIATGADLVVGTRYAHGGGIPDWDQKRRQMSDFATKVSRLLIGDQTSDPMSGFFMLRRDVIEQSVHDLSQQGYKILLDIISSAATPLHIEEVSYIFRNRREGESKVSLQVIAEFLFQIIEKVSHGLIPGRFVLFSAVGGLGLCVHLSILFLMKSYNIAFLPAQIAAISCAMLFNFFVNNELTYRDRRLKGWAFIPGLLVFCIICSIGALANIGVAELAIHRTSSWSLAGLAGALIGAAFNFGAASKLIWERVKKPKRRLKKKIS